METTEEIDTQKDTNENHYQKCYIDFIDEVSDWVSHKRGGRFEFPYLEEIDAFLSRWESDFLTDISYKDRPLTERQANKVNEVIDNAVTKMRRVKRRIK